jgi:hypothetical protein
MSTAPNEQPHVRMKELIAQSGIAVLNQPDQCEVWLRQACPQSAWEISLLMAALRAGVPAAILAPPAGTSPQQLRSDLVQRVRTGSGLAEDAAAWAVDAWAFILGVNWNAAPAQPEVRIQPQQQPQVNVPQNVYAAAQPQPVAQMQAQQTIPAQQYTQAGVVTAPIVTMPEVPGRVCPYCGTPTSAQMCVACQRDTTARRRVCPKCGRMTPSAEAACLGCARHFPNDLAWKIPVIIAVFVAAFIITLIIVANQ